MGLTRFFLNFNIYDVSESFENIFNIFTIKHKFTLLFLLVRVNRFYCVWNDGGDKSRVLRWNAPLFENFTELHHFFWFTSKNSSTIYLGWTCLSWCLRFWRVIGLFTGSINLVIILLWDQIMNHIILRIFITASLLSLCWTVFFYFLIVASWTWS